MNAQRARWVLAVQPGRDVLAVTDDDGHLWLRSTSLSKVGAGGEETDRWHPVHDPELLLTWVELLVEFGPLDEAQVPS